MRPTGTVRIARIARRRHGAFTRAQALACGFSDSGIGRRLRAGVWIRAHAGVYTDPAVARSAEQDALAACLACGSGSVASHVTAARLLGLDLPAPALVHVTVGDDAQPRQRGIHVHRSRVLTSRDIARVDGVAITSAARTLIDLAAVLEPAKLELAFDALWRRGSVDPETIARLLEERSNRKRRGTGVLRRLASERVGQRPPGSDLETIYLQILRSFGVPLPVRQHPVRTRSGRRFIDLAYPDRKVAIELDGFGEHARDRRVFDDDRVRRNDLETLRWSVRQFSWTHCVDDPVYVAVTTAEANELVPARWRPRV